MNRYRSVKGGKPTKRIACSPVRTDGYRAKGRGSVDVALVHIVLHRGLDPSFASDMDAVWRSESVGSLEFIDALTTLHQLSHGPKVSRRERRARLGGRGRACRGGCRGRDGIGRVGVRLSGSDWSDQRSRRQGQLSGSVGSRVGHPTYQS